VLLSLCFLRGAFQPSNFFIKSVTVLIIMSSRSHTSDEISFLSFTKDATDYSWSKLRQDFAAAFAVALLTLPQVMGYSVLVGLPLFCGLFAAIYASAIAALFGSSRHIVVGPSNAMAILVQTGAAQILFTYYRDLAGPQREFAALQIITLLSFLVGIFQILIAALKLGHLTRFVSHSVIVGYMGGTAIAIVISQLFSLFGISRPDGVNSFYERAVYFLTHLTEIYWPTAIIGLGSLWLIVALKKIDKRIPSSLVAFALAGIVVHYFGLNDYDVNSLDDSKRTLLVGDIASSFDVIPTLQWPFFDLSILNAALPIAFAVAMVSIMESISVAKAISASTGQRLSVNQDIFGIGLGNLLCSFFAGIPIAGSPSRSTLNYSYGAQTRFAAILAAMLVAFILYVFGPLVALIPLASLAGLLLYNVTSIIDSRQFFLCAKATGSDAFVLWLTMLSCVFFSLDVAFYIGIVVSITLYLKKAAIPQLKEYEVDEFGELHSLETLDPQDTPRPIRVIKVEGELFFGAADLFQTTLKSITEDETSGRVVILQLKNARDMDATSCLALHQLYDYLKGSGRHLIACGLTWQIWEVLSDAGTVEKIGKENLFIFDERHPHDFMHKALLHAKRLLAEDNSKQEAFEPISEELVEVSSINQDTPLPQEGPN
jgi:SulP family sulfate permease